MGGVSDEAEGGGAGENVIIERARVRGESADAGARGVNDGWRHGVRAAAAGVRAEADGVCGAGVRLLGYTGGFSGEKRDDDRLPQPLLLPSMICAHASLAKSKLFV
jgi:hypothetical protein